MDGRSFGVGQGSNAACRICVVWPLYASPVTPLAPSGSAWSARETPGGGSTGGTGGRSAGRRCDYDLHRPPDADAIWKITFGGETDMALFLLSLLSLHFGAVHAHR